MAEKEGDARHNNDELSPVSSACKLRVGCALLPKKVSRYLTPVMLSIAREAGIELCLIDCSKSLLEQGPFNAIIHKLRPSREWETMLQEYAKAHPQVRVIDRVDGIRTLRNRATMLSVLQGEGFIMQSPNDLRSSVVRIQAPIQVEIPEGATIHEAEVMVSLSGMKPPLLVKPLWTDGREGSHGLAVLHDLPSLSKLLGGDLSPSFRPPVVIQQFVEHGGVLHKVYVVGDTTVVCKRPSLGDNYMGPSSGDKDLYRLLPRLSCKSVTFDIRAPSTVTDSEGCPSPPDRPMPEWAAGQNDSESEHATPISGPNSPSNRPPEWVTTHLAQELRNRLGLSLFNFDLICPLGGSPDGEDLYYVIDINYFPGVDKIPGFEHVFVQFLQEACCGVLDSAALQ